MGISGNGEAAMCAELIDPFCVQPIFVEGLASIRKIGKTNIEYTLFSVIDGMRVVAARIVWPVDAVITANGQARGYFENGEMLSVDAAGTRLAAH